MRLARATRAGWLLAAALVVGLPATAAADHEAFSPASVPPLLPGGAALGSAGGLDGTTHAYAGTGPCVTGEAPQGYPHAAVYRITSTTRSLLSVVVRDEREGTRSLCRVSLYAGAAGSASFRDPFDEAQRDLLLLEETQACAVASRCSLERWLTAGATTFLVAWADPVGAGLGPEASFRYDVSLRRPVSVTRSVSGHRIRDTCYGYHEVIKGRTVTITASVAPETTGTVRFAWYGKTDSGDWVLLRNEDRSLSDGEARFAVKAAADGKRRAKVSFLGNATTLPATAASVHVRYVSPSWYRYADGGVRLRVPWYRQQYSLTCEAAALRMAHNYHNAGSIDGDLEALRVIGVDDRLRSGNRWGNPNRAFVGNYDGEMMTTGYGVHYRPVLRAADEFDECRPSMGLVGPSYATIAKHVNNGYPVIVWGAHPGRTGVYKYHWYAWDGEYITAWSVEHVWVVVGFHGSASRPTSFIVHNSSRASGSAYEWVSLSEFTSFTKYFKRGVAVRG